MFASDEFCFFILNSYFIFSLWYINGLLSVSILGTYNIYQLRKNNNCSVENGAIFVGINLSGH